ncbi:hypothetical protein HK098_007661 [Nowakowskiella sp. JEL0407]|nr:hypothetical protein HK098_007661 [Nowakowskiella sp. JEL0407]
MKSSVNRNEECSSQQSPFTSTLITKLKFLHKLSEQNNSFATRRGSKSDDLEDSEESTDDCYETTTNESEDETEDELEDIATQVLVRNTSFFRRNSVKGVESLESQLSHKLAISSLSRYESNFNNAKNIPEKSPTFSKCSSVVTRTNSHVGFKAGLSQTSASCEWSDEDDHFSSFKPCDTHVREFRDGSAQLALANETHIDIIHREKLTPSRVLSQSFKGIVDEKRPLLDTNSPVSYLTQYPMNVDIHAEVPARETLGPVPSTNVSCFWNCIH